MSDLYLIAHKVRGEPAFDIAEPIKFGDENGWIIPTSGHRAYPFWSAKIDDLADMSGVDPSWVWCHATDNVDGWESIPDHYFCSNKITAVSPSKVTEINLEELDL